MDTEERETPATGDPARAASTEEFLRVLARFRIAAGDSYKVLQARTDIPHSTLYDTLNGQRRRPRTEVVERLVRIYAPDATKAQAWLDTWTRLVLAEHSTDEVVPDEAAVDASPTAHPAEPASLTGSPQAAQSQAAAAQAQIAPSQTAQPPAVPSRGVPAKRFRSPRTIALIAALVLTALATSGALAWRASRANVAAAAAADKTRQQQAASATGTMITVYNIEKACQPLRTIECGLALSRDPWARTGRENVAGRVWHTDRLIADCVVPDGRLITDETGMSSFRWYHVTVPGRGISGWLPGVRTRNLNEVPYCRTRNRAPLPNTPAPATPVALER